MSKSKIPAEHIVAAITSGPRWAIIQALTEPKSAPVVAEELGLGASNVSYHLKQLVKAGVVIEYQQPDTKRHKVYQRQRIFAEVLIDFQEGEGEERLTDLNVSISRAPKPRNHTEVKPGA